MFLLNVKVTIVFIITIVFASLNKSDLNFGFENISFISLRESVEKVRRSNIMSEDSISENVPKLFENISPLKMELAEIKIDPTLFQNSNTSRALNCYESLPQYTLIRGILSEYSYFLTMYYRLKCEHDHEYHDGTICGDTLFLIDILENKGEILREKFLNKKNECFLLEANAISVQSRYFESSGFVGRPGNILNDYELLMLERSFLRRIITQFESTLTKKTIEYELSCMKKEKSEGNSTDCHLLRTECWILESELLSLSEEHFKRVSMFQRMKDVLV